MKKIFLLFFAIIFGIIAIGQTHVNYKTPEQKLNDQYCTGLFKTAEGVILDVESNSSASAYINILDWLESRVSGLKVYQTRYGLRIPFIRNQFANVYVDEIQVNASYLNALPTSDIAMIKVIKSPFLGGFNGGGSAIAIYTFGVDLDEEE